MDIDEVCRFVNQSKSHCGRFYWGINGNNEWSGEFYRPPIEGESEGSANLAFPAACGSRGRSRPRDGGKVKQDYKSQ